MAVITLQYQDSSIPQNGFGYLVPSCEESDVLGITFDSLIFPQNAPDNSSIVTVMAGGPRFHELFGEEKNNEAVVAKATDIAARSVRETLNFEKEPSRHVTKIQKECIPQYHVGHYKLAENIQSYLLAQNLPLTIVGNMWGGVGVNDVIVNARNSTLTWLTSNHLC